MSLICTNKSSNKLLTCHSSTSVSSRYPPVKTQCYSLKLQDVLGGASFLFNCPYSWRVPSGRSYASPLLAALGHCVCCEVFLLTIVFKDPGEVNIPLLLVRWQERIVSSHKNKGTTVAESAPVWSMDFHLEALSHHDRGPCQNVMLALSKGSVFGSRL